MAASPIQNQQILGPDGRWDFSNLADTVSLENFPDSLGQPTRMNGGDDQVTGSSIPIPGWFNDVNGNLGNDFLVGGTGRDKYLGGNENDFLAGDAGADWLNGNVGNDNVSGGAGNDIVRGGAGNDFVFGEAGDDIVTGDLGKDFLNGGAGNDRFVLPTDAANTSPNAFEVDVITDFSLLGGNKDKIVLPGVASFSELEFTNTVLDGVAGTLIGFKSGNFIGFVQNITPASLAAGAGSNFVLGATADDFFAKITPDFFLQNPNMATDLIPV